MVVDDSGLVRPGDRRRAAGGQELVDTVEGHLVRQRLRGAHGDLGVVGVHRDLAGAGAGRRHRRSAATATYPTTSSNRDPGRPPAARPAAAASTRPTRPAGPRAPEARPAPSEADSAGERRRALRRRWRPSCGAPRPGAAPDRTASTRGRSAPARRGWARRRPRRGRRSTVRRSAAAGRGTPESFHTGFLPPRSDNRKGFPGRRGGCPCRQHTRSGAARESGHEFSPGDIGRCTLRCRRRARSGRTPRNRAEPRRQDRPRWPRAPPSRCASLEGHAPPPTGP